MLTFYHTKLSLCVYYDLYVSVILLSLDTNEVGLTLLNIMCVFYANMCVFYANMCVNYAKKVLLY
jgi:hypothetical protein